MEAKNKPVPGNEESQGADARAPAHEQRQALYPGIDLDWSSESVPVRLRVELPFWLAIPECEVGIEIDATAVKASVSSRVMEIQSGGQFLDSHRNVVALVDLDAEPTAEIDELIRRTKPAVIRYMRTVVSFEAAAIRDAIDALQASQRRSVDGLMYLQALIHGHVPFVNKLINAYRSSSTDPFSFEVAEWDVPVWFVTFKNCVIPISLMAYRSLDAPLHGGRLGAEPTRTAFTSVEELAVALTQDMTPGEKDLLDAWSLFFRGRYADAVRTMVTAIEVVLEDRLRTAWLAAGAEREHVEQTLRSSRLGFQARLDTYLAMTGRRIPGPILCIVPYINGLRLADELKNVRSLRHAVVHEGRYIDQRDYPAMLRVIETMTWLFAWFEQNEQKEAARKRNYSLQFTLRTRPPVFNYTYAAGGVRVEEFENPASPPFPIASDLIRSQLFRAIDPDGKDVEKCALMCIASLRLPFTDAPTDSRWPINVTERWYVRLGGDGCAVFLLDTPGLPNLGDVQAIAARAIAINLRVADLRSVLCIVNHQNGLAFQLRNVDDAISDDVCLVAEECGITLVTLVDLVLLSDAARRYDWTLAPIIEDLALPGRRGTVPPRYSAIGEAVRFFPALGVMSVDLLSGSEVRVGDLIVVRLRDSYHEQRITSMQRDKQSVTEAAGPGRVGIKTMLSRRDFAAGGSVYLSRMQDAANTVNDSATPSQR